MSDHLTKASHGLHSHQYVEGQVKNPTPQEIRFKQFLLSFLRREEYWRNSPAYHPVFQYPIRHPKGFYIIDVFFPKLRMGFEIDGGIHWRSDRVDYDIQRRNYWENEYSIKLYSIPNQIIDSKKLLRKYFKSEVPPIIECAVNRRKYYLEQKNKIKKMHIRGKFDYRTYQSIKERIYWDSISMLPQSLAVSVLGEK